MNEQSVQELITEISANLKELERARRAREGKHRTPGMNEFESGMASGLSNASSIVRDVYDAWKEGRKFSIEVYLPRPIQD